MRKSSLDIVKNNPEILRYLIKNKLVFEIKRIMEESVINAIDMLDIEENFYNVNTKIVKIITKFKKEYIKNSDIINDIDSINEIINKKSEEFMNETYKIISEYSQDKVNKDLEAKISLNILEHSYEFEYMITNGTINEEARNRISELIKDSDLNDNLKSLVFKFGGSIFHTKIDQFITDIQSLTTEKDHTATVANNQEFEALTPRINYIIAEMRKKRNKEPVSNKKNKTVVVGHIRDNIKK